MPLTVRNKLRLGTLFLFVLLVLAGGSGIYFTSVLKQDARAILTDNYESISYCNEIERNLDSLGAGFAHHIGSIGQTLMLQEQNITEPGEKELTASLRATFERLAAGDTSAAHIAMMRHVIRYIMSLNMQAIYQKNTRAEADA